jgi:hypothetical protein
MGLSTAFLRFCQEKIINSYLWAVWVPLRQKRLSKKQRQGEWDGWPSRGGCRQIRAKDEQTQIQKCGYVVNLPWSKRFPKSDKVIADPSLLAQKKCQ